ncbi:hypothetical protein [Acidisoma sp. 7E03]
MSFDTYRAYQLSDPFQNRHFQRPCLDRAYSAAELDRLSDHELSVGHVQRAEMLAWRAAAMREDSRA